jgi:hypothetical protein
MKVEPSANLYPHKIQQAGLFQGVIIYSSNTPISIMVRRALGRLF